MHGLPRISMISLDLKESNEVPDLSPLYGYIESHYNENSENYKDAFKEFLNLRQLSISGSENLNCLTSMKRYYSQLQLLKARFPISSNDTNPILWYWEDSSSNTSISLPDIRFEEASILYNIGSLHCNLGAKEGRIDLDSTKVACTHFQCSAWAFQTILDKYTPLAVADLECDLLRFLNLLMLAQAHECVLEKSMVDQRRAGITAKIAFQISDFYKQCQGLLRSENIGYAVNSKHYKNWKRTCTLKEHLYFCLSYYYMALMAEEANKYGDIVAWMKLAKEKLDKCLKSVKELKSNSAEETIKFVQDVINGKLESAIKDNNFVYYAKVPEPDMLPPIKGAMLLKGIGFDASDIEIIGKDIFRNLIPMETHFSASVYSEKKDGILRNIQNDVDIKNEEIQQFLNNMQWDNENLALIDSKVPQELYSCAAFISANPNILTTIKNTMQDISSISIEVEESLETLSNRIRTAKIDKSLDLWKSLEQEYSESINNFEDAKESNNQLREAFACTLGDFAIMKQPMETIVNSLPSIKEYSEKEDSKKLIEESHRLLGKVNEMSKQRLDLLQQLKTQMMNDDLTHQLLSTKDESERNKIIDEGLKKHDELIDYLRQNISAQSRIMDAIVEHNAQIADIKINISQVKHEREKIFTRIIRSFNYYQDIIKKGEEGIEFYRKLSSRINKLQKDVDKLNPVKPKVLVPEVKPLSQVNNAIEKENDLNILKSNLTVKPESEPSNFNSQILVNKSLPNQPLRLKDYLKDRKKTQSSSKNTQEVPQVNNHIQEQDFESGINPSPYLYMPWGFYGPPCGQTAYTPNYSVSKCKTQDSEFRTTHNAYLPPPSSEIGTGNSTYLNYSSLPRTNYSSFSSSYITPMSSAASIGNLSSNTGFTIPYQQNSFDNPNIISMAHGFGQNPLPVNKSTSGEFETHQYCSYPYTHEIKDSQYFSQIQNIYSDSGYVNNMQHFRPNLNSQSNQPNTSNFSTTDNIQQPLSINDSKYMQQNEQQHALYAYQNYQLNSQGILPNQYSNLQSSNQQQNFSQYSNYYPSTTMSNYQINQCPKLSQSDKFPVSQASYESSENLLTSKKSEVCHQNQDALISKPNQTVQKPIEKQIYSLPVSNKNTFSQTNIASNSQNKLEKLNSTDLLSSSPTNACKQENSFAVLSPKILTKQEIEDQKEEKRKQIYHKQHSGSKQPFNDHLILNKFISDAERFLKKINDLLDSNNSVMFEQHWNQLILKERNLPKKSTAIAKCSPMKNRMQDSVPYDENRVIIKDGKDDYINASHILLQNIDECFPRFITCQSPLSNTVSEFWTAIFEQGCEILVQLAAPCSIDDSSKSRVVTYWPDPKSKSLSVGSKFEISVQSFKEKPNWEERILLIKHLKTNQSRSVWHFHVHNVSNKLPKSLDEFLSFESELCRYYRQQRSLTKPIGISCINGSSGSGLFLLLTAAMLQMEITGTFPDVDNILLSMWQQRKNLLDDKHQLMFVYKAMSKASSDLLSKKNIVIGPGRIVSNTHSTVSEHSHSPVVSCTNTVAPINSSSSSIIDSIFTNQHLQISDLDSVLSKWTVKQEENAQENVKTIINKTVCSTNESDILISEMSSHTPINKTTKNIQLPSTLIHLQDPSSIDFTPTPADKRKMTKKEFEAKLNNTFVQPNTNLDSFDPLKDLDPIHQLH